jgi:hypothetical protein
LARLCSALALPTLGEGEAKSDEGKKTSLT